MKFKKFGKALLMGALSLGVVLGVSSCVQSYSVGYLYVTGTETAQTGNNGILSGYKIDHNTGKLTPIVGLPISSGGANPERAVLITGSRFLYVLNRGANASGGSTCTTANPCENSNITEFAVGGNGILTPQATFYTQGVNPIRMIGDSSGNFLMVLDHDAPSSAACALALGSTVTSCGDVTVFSVNQTTGRLTLIENAQVTASAGAPLTYFPVPVNPIDFVMTSGTLLTLSGSPSTGDSVFPYSYAASSGQMTINQNTSQPLGVKEANSIVSAGGVIYILDDEAVTIPSGSSFSAGTYPSQILPFTVGNNGALQADTGGIIPDDATLANPTQLLVESSKGKFLYVANQGNNTTGANANSGLAAYFITTSPSYQLSFVAHEPFGSGSGPQCIVEDPSDQFIYEANSFDSTITGRVVDPNSGVLNSLPVAGSYTLNGPPTWCVVDGRTS